MVVVIIILLIFGVIAIIAVNMPTSPNKQIDEGTKERRRKLAEKFQKEAEEKDSREKQLMIDLESKYGKCQKIIRFYSKYEKWYSPIRCFSNTIMLKDKIYPFTDILGYELKDDTHIISSGGVIKGESNTMNTVGRSVVGSAIAGSTGAILGGMSTSRKYSISPSVSSTVHNYTLYINVNDLANPIIRYKLEEDFNLAMEIVGIIKIITQSKD